jgi:hypothetical protein
MTAVKTRWYPGMLKDYTCSLVWGPDISRTFILLHSLLQGCHGETEVLTYRKDAAWGRRVKSYSTIEELQQELKPLLDGDNDTHTNFILDIGSELSLQLQKELAQFLTTKREHNTTLIVLCEKLEYLGSVRYRFDLVFHALPMQPGNTQYQRWINDANKEGVLVTESLEWLYERNPELLMEIAIIGCYILKGHSVL